MIICLAVIGCKGETKHDSKEQVISPKEYQGQDPDTVGRDIAQKQSQGLKNATATAFRAYIYQGSASYVEEPDKYKLVAVDVTFSGSSENFDLDDVDLINGVTGVNYGSDPEIAFLKDDGSFKAWSVDELHDPFRVLLVYMVPKSVASIKLSYWGQNLVKNPVRIEASGPMMPVPE